MSNVIPAEFSQVATLCTAKEAVIGSQVVLGVDARALHKGLGVGRDFSNWIKGRIDALGFEEGVDYEKNSRSPVLASGNRGAGNDYTLTLDAAKHLAMVEKNETGRLIRSYFIWVEKQARQPSPEALTAQQTGGIVKGVVARALRTEGPSIVRAILAEQGFSLVEDYKTANAWLIEYKAHQKGRSGLTQRVGRTLHRLCEDMGIPRHRCAISGKWLYPAAVARPFFKGTGGHWVTMHNAAVLGQEAIHFGHETA